MLDHPLDPLTWLPGRKTFDERLAQALRAGAGRALAVLLIDLDGMRGVNDLIGRELGNQVLREAAARIARALGAGVPLARLENDDFAAFAAGADLEAAVGLAHAVLQECRVPYVLGCVSVRATASIGVALYPSDARSCVGLLACAKDALYRARTGGGDRCFAGSAA